MKKYINLPFIVGAALAIILLYFLTGKWQWSYGITFIIGSILGTVIINLFLKKTDKD
ncbi:hypothetical protein ACFDTO_32395 [Microbacteriaceae bacterium 4G12]